MAAAADMLLERFAEEQEKFLPALLEKHSSCEYLQRHGLNGRTDVESFKEVIPVIEYDAIEQDIHRLLNGDTASLGLCCEKVLEFFASSGTSSGRRKLFPATEAWYSAAEKLMNMRLDYLIQTFGEEAATGLSLTFASVGKRFQTPAGFTAGPATTSLLNRPAGNEGRGTFASPQSVILCDDFQQAMYCHLLCGLLRSSEVVSLRAAFASALANAFSRVLKDRWEEICTDIETGELSSSITHLPARADVSKLLEKPNPDLADSIRAECSKDSWEGILLRLWPNLRFVTCIATGSMLQYVDYLNFLTGGKLPIASAGYGASEGYFAINPCQSNPPEETFYVFIPDLGYYEFEPVGNISKSPGNGNENGKAGAIVDLARVEEGQEYELVVSTFSGLWRYRMGDVFKCVGFYHKTAPKFQFVGRKNVILSIHTDKTEEKELVQVVNRAAKLHLPATTHLLDFTSCTSVTSLPGHYVIFLELSPGDICGGNQTLVDMCHSMEASLSEPYRRGRIIGTIAPLELNTVRPGTFEKIKEAAVQQGSASVQYKVPRGFKAGHSALQILNAAVKERAHSTRPPPHPTLNPPATSGSQNRQAWP